LHIHCTRARDGPLSGHNKRNGICPNFGRATNPHRNGGRNRLNEVAPECSTVRRTFRDPPSASEARFFVLLRLQLVRGEEPGAYNCKDEFTASKFAYQLKRRVEEKSKHRRVKAVSSWDIKGLTKPPTLHKFRRAYSSL
jgi:hypothetical protein